MPPTADYISFYTLMMKFRTEYATRRFQGFLDPSRRVVMLGSCFTDNIGARIRDAQWPVTVNPCGTLFNPLSIARILTLACMDPETRRSQVDTRLFEHDGLWRSWDFSTLFASPTREECLRKCMDALSALRTGLEEASALILTLGTAWIYHLSDDDTPVSNCHKMPERIFTRRLETAETLSASLLRAIGRLKGIAPRDLKIILTLSPVRHLRDGLAGNSLSKATLRIAIETLCSTPAQVPSSSPDSTTGEFRIDYFPAYEIRMYDLRDYRF